MRRDVVHEKRRDDKFHGLKRRIATLARLDGEPVRLAEGLFLVQARHPRGAKAIIARLRAHGVLDRATLEEHMKLDATPVAIDAQTIAAAHRDIRALSQRPALELAREHRRALARYGAIDEAWLEKKRERVEQISALLSEPPHAGSSPPPTEHWFHGVITLVRAMRGEREASLLAAAAARVQARAAERRRDARRRVELLATSLRSGELPNDPELAEQAARLDAARELPGRARRRRVLDVLRRAVGWPAAPADAIAPALGAHEVGADYAALVEEAGRTMASSLPVVRDPSLREQNLELLALLALVFPIGDHGVPLEGDEGEAPALLQKLTELGEIAPSGLPLAKAIALAKIPMKRPTRLKIARWVKEGLEVDLVAEVASINHVEDLARVPDARAARAYATWATRLSAHYESQGVAFSLSPELFANLPKNEDLAVLAMCLMEQVDPKSESKAPDPIAVLDSTLALFQRLPAKARGILGNLRADAAGEGRSRFPELAGWLDDDARLDRLIHVARLAGEPPLPRAIREDFEHAARTRGERAHLEKLTTRSAPQQGRLDALLRAERTLAGSPRGRTRRRIAERIDRLLPAAYRRELDATFREILREAWGISVPTLTPAWRDAVRFWLIVDDNRALLGRLLKEASATPGRDVKPAFPKNEAWLLAARARMNVDAWLAPRRKEIVVRPDEAAPETKRKNARFVIELEEDPLEVLRMGIPFGTCLSLESGCNAASTVLNAIEANKRVLYVRNASGRVVARKLLAISKDGRLIGYNLYVSVRGAEEIAIRNAVLQMCRELAHDAGVPLAATGEPAQLHEGFWYDDGTAPFDEDVDVAAYCKSLGLPPPPKWYEDLGKEARAWRACETGDVDAAIGVLAVYDAGPANRSLGRWIVDRLGPRAAEKRALEDSSVFVALARTLADEDEHGMIRALDVAGRMPEYMLHHRLSPLLARFPPSPKLGVAIVDMGLRAIRRHARLTEHGLAHLTIFELVATFDDVSSALDLLDSIEPVWLHVTQALPSCERCVAVGVDRSVEVIEAIFERAPDPDVVVATLMSRRRTVLAQRAALRIAARHVLPNGDRALTRLCTLRPELASSPDGIAALLRQAEVDRVTEALARKAPVVSSSAPPFEALRDLLVTCEDVELLLGNAARVADIDRWAPGPWELAWRRRRQDPELRDGLFARAARAPRSATRAMELLALLGDMKRIGALEHVSTTSRKGGQDASTSKATAHDSPQACRRTAASLVDQVEAERRGRVDPDVTAMPHTDAAYVDLARRALIDETTDDASRDIARDIVLRCEGAGVVDFERLLASSLRERIDPETASRLLLEEKVPGRLPLRIVVDAWQIEDVREALVRSLEARRDPYWCTHVWAAEREAKARGLSVEGLLERVALALVTGKDPEAALQAETLDQLRSILNALAAEAAPSDLARVYEKLDDTLAIAMFLRAIRRQPLTRSAELREAVRKLDLSSDTGRALEAWLEVTRSNSASRARTTAPRVLTQGEPHAPDAGGARD
ncbi:MAG: hypothetical protein BGO98_33630 [Myxococcales bacterium 68-20]|nr:MAG: hypothetical protein BGO98_33630 [Myxococcales bacterium 68-20]